MADHFPEGVYERLRTSHLDDLLAGADPLQPTFSPVDSAVAPDILARHLADVLRRALADESDPARRVALVNTLLQHLQADGQQVRDELEQLVTLQRPLGPGVPVLTRPRTPLSDAP